MRKLLSLLRGFVRRWLTILCLFAWLVACWELWSAREPVPRGKILEGIFRPGQAARLSPGGQLLCRWRVPSLDVWDTETGDRRYQLRSFIWGWAGPIVSGDGANMLTEVDVPPAGNDPVFGSLVIWNSLTGRRKTSLPYDAVLLGAAFSPDGGALATTDISGVIHLWDLATKTQTTVFPGENGGAVQATSVAFSPDGRTLAYPAASKNNLHNPPIALYDRLTNQQRLLISTPKSVGQCDVLVFSPHSKILATGAFAIRLLDVATGSEIATYESGRWINCLAFSPDGKLLAASTSKRQDLTSALGPVIGWKIASKLPLEEQTVLLDVATGKRLAVLPFACSSLAFRADGTLMTVSPQQDAILLWDVPPRTAMRPMLAWRSMLVALLTTGVWWFTTRRTKPRHALARPMPG